MEQRKWFYLHQEIVHGPFTNSELEKKITEQQWQESRFWARGKSQWLSAAQYRQELINEEELEKQKKLSQTERLWKVKDHDTELEPMKYENLILFLKEKKNLGNIKLWTDGYNEWQEVYHVEKILDELGINRRQHPRVPINGKINIETQNGISWEGEISMISQGGFGIKKASSITIGEKVKANIITPALRTNIHCTAEVVFINKQGYAGFRFLNISMEAKSSVIAYVKQFVEDHPDESFIKMS